MADYQHIVDELRAYLASPGDMGPVELDPLASEFARHCREANERLRECRDYLRKGLRSEAIHLAEKHPILLDVFSALDFSELPEWRLACTSLNLTAPPQLTVEAAQALSDAYAEEMPLQSLLMVHRTLHLAQAPLEPRIRILRKIAAADAGTLFWGDDLEALERLRLPEIEAQAKDAERRGELVRLESLVQEVRESNWRVTIPAQFKSKLEESLERLTHKTGEQMLRSLLPQLETAYSAMDLTECASVLAKWDHIAKVCRQNLPADLLDRAVAPRGWVKQEQSKTASSRLFDEACAILQAALDRDLPTVELEKLYLGTTRFPFDLSVDLERRYQQRLSDRAASTRRRHNLTLAAIAAVVVIAIGITGFLFYRSTYNANVKQWVSAAKDAEDAVAYRGDLPRGISVRESIERDGSRYLTDPDLAAEIARLDAAIRTERQRQDDFKSKLAQLQGANGLDEVALKAAVALALRPDEKSAIQTIQDNFAQAQETNQRQADQKFMETVAALRERMDKQLTPSLLQSDREVYLRELATCDATITELERQPGVTESTRQSIITTLRALLKQASTTLTAADMDRIKTQGVAESESSALNQAALKDYLEALPSGTKRDSFTAALQRVPGDADVEAWDALSARWSGEFTPKTEAIAGSRLAEVEGYLTDHPKSPILPMVSNYRDYLKRGVDAVAEDGVWKRTLVRQMSADLYTRLYIVETKGAKSYYTPEKLNYRVDSIGSAIDAFLSPDLTAAVRVVLSPGDTTLVQPPPTNAPKSPQMIAAEAVRASVREMTFDQWPFIGLAASETFRTSKCHPVLEASTLLRIAQLNQETLDWAVGEKLTPAIKRLTDLKLGDMPWINPDDQVSSQTLGDVAAATSAIPPASELRKLVQMQIAAINQSLATGFIGKGCLIGMPNEPAGISTKVKAEDGLVAFAVNPQLPKSYEDPMFVRAGHAESGKWVVEPSIPDKIPEGTLLFIAPRK